MAEDFVVNVSAGGTATRAHESNGLPFFNQISRLYQVFLVVCVAGDKAITVGDLDHLAIACFLASPGHDTGGDVPCDID